MRWQRIERLFKRAGKTQNADDDDDDYKEEEEENFIQLKATNVADSVRRAEEVICTVIKYSATKLNYFE